MNRDVTEQENQQNSKSKQVSRLFQRPTQRLQVDWIPRSQFKPTSTFYLPGEIFIDLNFEEHPRLSYINNYKQVQNVTVLNNPGVLWFNILSKVSEYNNHEQAIQYIGQHQNEICRGIAEKLRFHKHELQRDYEVKKMMLQIVNLNPFIKSNVHQRNLEYQNLFQSVISNLPKTRYFMFTEFAFDYSQMIYQMKSGGFNEAFLKMFGCDLSNMQEILLRKGIYELVESRCRWELIFEFLNFSRDHSILMRKNHVGRIKIITLDDISIDAPYSSTFYSSGSNQVFQSLFNNSYNSYLFDKGFIVTEIILSDFHIQKLNSIRQKFIENPSDEFDSCFNPHLLPFSKSESSDNINENQGNSTIQSSNITASVTDIPYSVQTQYFLEKFYPQKPIPTLKSLPQDEYPSKTCKYRLIQ